MALLKKTLAGTKPEDTKKSIANPTKGGLVGLMVLLLGFLLVAIIVSTSVQLINSSAVSYTHLTLPTILLV